MHEKVREKGRDKEREKREREGMNFRDRFSKGNAVVEGRGRYFRRNSIPTGKRG